MQAVINTSDKLAERLAYYQQKVKTLNEERIDSLKREKSYLSQECRRHYNILVSCSPASVKFRYFSWRYNKDTKQIKEIEARIRALEEEIYD